MTLRSVITRVVQNEDLNFLLTNRIPRSMATRFMGWFSRLESPWLCRASIAAWRLFANLDLSDAKQPRFRSLHECFIRELVDGARPICADEVVLVSPCDAIVGEYGQVDSGRVFQTKGFPYALHDLLHDDQLVSLLNEGIYVTLRITSSMYHRFHAPADCRVRQVTYISGDTWNVNPIALKRVERLFCKNERAVVRLTLNDNQSEIVIVPVAAILVAGIRLHCLDRVLDLSHRGANHFECDAMYRKGDEMGWFQHGSTIIAFAPKGFTIHSSIVTGKTLQMGEPLFARPR